jgi:hypothetical protein
MQGVYCIPARNAWRRRQPAFLPFQGELTQVKLGHIRGS